MSDRAPEQVRYLLDAEEALGDARAFAEMGEPLLAQLYALIGSASATLASLPAGLWRDAATRRELEARALVERGQTLAEPPLVEKWVDDGTPGAPSHRIEVPTPLDLERARALRRLRESIR